MKTIIARVPLAAAVLLATSPLLGSFGATVVNKPVAATAAPAQTQGTVHKISMKTGMPGGKKVFLDDKGAPNPVLSRKVGDTQEITIASAEGASEH